MVRERRGAYTAQQHRQEDGSQNVESARGQPAYRKHQEGRERRSARELANTDSSHREEEDVDQDPSTLPGHQSEHSSRGGDQQASIHRVPRRRYRGHFILNIRPK